jgi:tRNA pseudouridine55 synthase
VGAFTLNEAHTLDELGSLDDPVTMPMAQAAGRCFHRREATEDEAKILSHGGPLEPIGVQGPYAVFAPSGAVLAVVEERDGKAKPQIVLV